MINDPGRARRLLVLAGAALALLAIPGGSAVLAGSGRPQASEAPVATVSAATTTTPSEAPTATASAEEPTAAPPVKTSAPTTGQTNPFDAAVDALVLDGTIDAHQAGVLRQDIAAGSIDPRQLVSDGTFTAAQMQAVTDRLDAVKRSLATAEGTSPDPSAKTKAARDAGTAPDAGKTAADAAAMNAVKEAADAAVQALVADGTINQHQADVLRQQIDAGSVDEEALVSSGTLTAAQMETVRAKLVAVKESFAGQIGEAPPDASKSPSSTK
jgi:hypothetical protein